MTRAVWRAGLETYAKSKAPLSCALWRRACRLAAGTVSRREKKAARVAANRDYLGGSLR